MKYLFVFLFLFTKWGMFYCQEDTVDVYSIENNKRIIKYDKKRLKEEMKYILAYCKDSVKIKSIQKINVINIGGNFLSFYYVDFKDTLLHFSFNTAKHVYKRPIFEVDSVLLRNYRTNRFDSIFNRFQVNTCVRCPSVLYFEAYYFFGYMYVSKRVFISKSYGPHIIYYIEKKAKRLKELEEKKASPEAPDNK